LVWKVIYPGIGYLRFQTENNPKTEDYAKKFLASIYILKQYAIAERNQWKLTESEFDQVASVYRQATTKPVLPEEARRLKVQAEGAIREKNLIDALEFYKEALKVAPWWPEGHFNRSMILGETEDYELAASEMKRYLQLVPDAPNARAAQDKIYIWEGPIPK
jgi:tetratricopeptide (TPR) repeat protein